MSMSSVRIGPSKSHHLAGGGGGGRNIYSHGLAGDRFSMIASAAAPANVLPRAIRELNTALKVVAFYPPQHPVVRVASDRFLSTLNGALASVPEVELGFGEVGILHAGNYLPDSDKGLE